MIFLSGEAGKIPGSKFQKEVNGKLFSYSGEADFGVFIEEIVYKALYSRDPAFKNEPTQLIVILDDSVFFINLNDADKQYVGESTFEYSRNDFKDSEIMEYISDNIYSREDLVLVEYDSTSKIFSYHREKDGIDLNVNFDDIEIDTLISSSKRLKKMFSENLYSFLFVLLIFIFPLITITPLNNMLNTYELEVKKLDIVEKKLTIEKSKKDMAVLDITKRFASIENTKDLFSNVKLLEKVMTLEIVPMIPIAEENKILPLQSLDNTKKDLGLKTIKQLSEEEKYKDVPLPPLK